MTAVKIAFLHYDCISKNTVENLKQLTEGICIAAENGADWILTPELALQGYHFSLFGRINEIYDNLEEVISPILQAAKKYRVYIFLGCAVKDNKKGTLHNSCLVIDTEGIIKGRCDKRFIHGRAETRFCAGKTSELFECGRIKTGILLCSDIFYKENIILMKELKPEVIIVPAAWAAGYGITPGKIWSDFSSSLKNIPILICNQTGSDFKINCNLAESTVLNNGEILMSYKGKPAILFTEINFSENKIAQRQFIKV